MKDLGKAFSAYFRDPRWLVKSLIAILFMLLSIVGIGILILAGYFVQVTQRVMRREEPALPEWTGIGHMIVLGFKFCVAYLVYLIPMFILFLPIFAMAIVSAGLDDGGTLPLFLSVYVFGITLLLIPYGLILSLITPIIQFRIAERERISDALDLAVIARTFRDHWQNALVVAVIAFGIQSIASLGIILLGVGIFFTIFYSYVVSSYLSGILYNAIHQQEAPLV